MIYFLLHERLESGCEAQHHKNMWHTNGGDADSYYYYGDEYVDAIIIFIQL